MPTTIQVHRNLAAPWPPYTEGQQVDTDDDTATALVQSGLAELIQAVPPAKKPIKAVPPERAEAPVAEAPKADDSKPADAKVADQVPDKTAPAKK